MVVFAHGHNKRRKFSKIAFLYRHKQPYKRRRFGLERDLKAKI